jgi:hypothetical protein
MPKFRACAGMQAPGYTAIRVTRLAAQQCTGCPCATRRDTVYNITDWVAAYPGSEVILEAAGGSIDPYWGIFTIHNTACIYELLEQYRIRFVHSDDLINSKPTVHETEDPFQHNLPRDSKLRIITAKPCNVKRLMTHRAAPSPRTSLFMCGTTCGCLRLWTKNSTSRSSCLMVLPNIRRCKISVTNSSL